MWLSKQLAGSTAEQAVAEFGSVTMEGASTAVVTEGERRGISTVFPGGYAYRAKTGETVAVLRCGNTALIQGTVSDTIPEELEVGEVKIFAAGGAAIVLKNDGRILLQGNVTVNGTLITEGE
ncbi:MAG: hypothetical protein ACOX7K_10000 [Oscillospiraceae bacterium]|jgi:hypothetical protein